MKNQLNKPQTETENPMELTELTKEFLTGYINGQLQIQNEKIASICRGAIESIEIDEQNQLVINLSWAAELAGCPSNPKGWVKSEQLSYNFPLGRIYTINLSLHDKLYLDSCYRDEKVTIFPPSAEGLDPFRAGLDPQTMRTTLVLTA